MVVQRSHFEKPLAMGGLEVGHLNDIGHRLGDVDDPHRDQDQRCAEGKAQGRHRAAQEQAARVAHKDLGRMVVVDKERRQPAGHRRREQGLGPLALPQKSGHGKKYHHHKGHASGQAVDAVGQVHRVDAAHDDKGRKDQIHDPVQGEGHPEEGHIQLVGHQPLIAHQAQKQDRRRQLEHKLLPGGQALVLVLAHLAVVIHKADHAKDQGEQEDVQVDKAPPQHLSPAQQEHRDACAQNEHDAAHGGGARLGLVPGGAVGPDLLAGLELAQLRQDEPPDDQRQYKADHKCQQQLLHNSLPFVDPAPQAAHPGCRAAGSLPGA